LTLNFGPINDSPLDHNPELFYQNLPHSPDPAAAGKSHLISSGSDQGNYLKYYKNAENNALSLNLELTFRSLKKYF